MEDPATKTNVRDVSLVRSGYHHLISTLMYSKCDFTSDTKACDACLGRADTCSKRNAKKPQDTFHAISDNSTNSSIDPPSTPFPSRALGNPIHESSCTTNDAQVLGYAYSGQFASDWEGNIHIEVMSQLFRNFAFVYGPNIPKSALRHAVCAYIGAYSGRAVVTDHDQFLHVHLACQELRRMVADPETLSEEAVFVCGLLAMWCSMKEMVENESFVRHRNGMVSVMSHFFSKADGRLDSYQLSLFWPMLRSEIYYHVDLIKFEDPLFINERTDETWSFFESCRRVLGIETRSQCRKYGRELEFKDGIIDRHECLAALSNFIFLTKELDKLGDGKSIHRVDRKTMLLDIYTDVQNIRDHEDMSDMDAIDLTGKFLFPSEVDRQVLGSFSFSEVCRAFSRVNAVLVTLSSIGFAAGGPGARL